MTFARLPLFLVGLFSTFTVHADFSLLSGVSLPGGGRMLAHYDAPEGPDLILTTRSLRDIEFATHRVEIFTLSTSGALTQVNSVFLSPLFGAADTLGVSSVAADPKGRGFGVATVIPADNTRVRGKLVFFDLPNGSILRVLDVGFHPEFVTFTPDGSRVIVANEGEFAASRPHVPGSVSVVDLAGTSTAASLLSIPPPVTTIDFRTGLAFGVSLDELRINVAEAPPAERYLHVEPESVTATNEKAYVTLQENNAIAVIDLIGARANRITAILPLGTITQIVDASDQDSAGAPRGAASHAAIKSRVSGLPMPDGIATFVVGGRRLLATANEGEARPDEGDIARAASRVDYVGNGADDVIAAQRGYYDDIDRLFISLVDGNLDADPLVEVPVMLGTRSFSLWDEAGNRIFDSGSMLEGFVKMNAPLTFNMDNGSTSAFDTRSDDRGPEPSALAYGEIEGRRYLFLGAERQNGIFQVDVTELKRVEIVGYYNAIDGVSVTTGKRYVTPEAMVFVAAEKSPTDRPLVIVGYEGVGSAIAGSIGVFEIVPNSGGVVNASFSAALPTGDTLVVGFTVEGADNVLLRGVGPGLAAAFGVFDVLEDPRIDLFRGTELILSNEDWAGSEGLVIAATAVGAFPIPRGSRDAAFLRPISGSHSVHLPARTPGRVLLEAYGVGPGSRFGNLSALRRMRTPRDSLIGGFVIRGAGTKSILIRAVGSSLDQFGIANPFFDPRLAVFNGATMIASNDGWLVEDALRQYGYSAVDTIASEADFAAAGAFPLRLNPVDSGSAALRLSLVPGAYTVHAVPSGMAYTGALLLEIYEIR